MFTFIPAITSLVEITALLVVLNFLANFIRFIYSITVNLIRFIQFITPIIVRFILITADTISWINSQIDWQFVAETVIQVAKSVAVALYTAGEFCGTKFYKWHANHTGVVIYNTIESESIVETNNEESEIVVDYNQPAIVSPLFIINEQLQSLTIKNIKQFQSAPKRIKKQSLIDSYLELAAI